ncbi:hypothetical protein EUTSA_v10005295mg [Eutrema salsugineum]|uniref:Prolamin-like domain-containing protein n=1 Tax=Eutrema salsugineum TaxID=72664 RepID=V4KXC9_EUTSA|nr:hypothetical protein EUTSA_v10005295mg [Eutrema salsugineum]
MEIKTFFMGFLLITILISSACPSLATKNDDEPLLDPDTSLEREFAKTPAPRGYNDDMLNKESSELMNYVLNCLKKRGLNCCLKIVQVGKECHMASTKIVFKLYNLKRFAPKSLFKANKIWNRCSDLNETPTPISR